MKENSWWNRSSNTLNLETKTVDDNDANNDEVGANRLSVLSREVAECAVISDLFTEGGKSQTSTVCTLNAPPWMIIASASYPTNSIANTADSAILVEATQMPSLPPMPQMPNLNSSVFSPTSPGSSVNIPPTQYQQQPQPVFKPPLLANIPLRDSTGSNLPVATQALLTSQDHEDEEEDVFTTPGTLVNVFAAATQNLFSPPQIELGPTQSDLLRTSIDQIRTSMQPDFMQTADLMRNSIGAASEARISNEVIIIPPSEYEEDEDDEETASPQASAVVNTPRRVQFDSQVIGGLSSQIQPPPAAAPCKEPVEPDLKGDSGVAKAVVADNLPQPVTAVPVSAQPMEDCVYSTSKSRKNRRISHISIQPNDPNRVVFEAVSEVRRLLPTIMPKTPNLPLKELRLSTGPAAPQGASLKRPAPTPSHGLTPAGKRRPPLLPKPTPTMVREGQIRFLAEVQAALQTPQPVKSTLPRIAPAPVNALPLDPNFLPDCLVWARWRAGWWAVGRLLRKSSPTRDLWQLCFLHKRTPIQLPRADLLALHAVQLEDTVGIIRKRSRLLVEAGNLQAWLNGAMVCIAEEEVSLDRVVIARSLFLRRSAEYAAGQHRQDLRMIEPCKGEAASLLKKAISGPSSRAISRVSSRSASRKPSRTPSPALPLPLLLTGQTLAITTGAAAEAERTRITNLCRQHGARLVEDPHGDCILLAPEGCRTVRFFHALILGLPIVRLEWVEASIAAGKLLSMAEYRLDDGRDRRGLLRGQFVALHGSPKFCQSWLPPMQAAGAQIADSYHSATLAVLENAELRPRSSRRQAPPRHQLTIDRLIEHLLSATLPLS